MLYPDLDPDAFDVRIAEMLTVTSEAGDPLVAPQVQEALGVLRRQLQMDVVFVSEFKGDKRLIRVVDNAPGETAMSPGRSDPLEKTWCKHVVDRRIPQFLKDAAPYVASGQLPAARAPIGTYVSTPIVLSDGAVYGTLCCFSKHVKEEATERDLRRLQVAARILADDLERAQARSRPKPPAFPDDFPPTQR